MINKYLLPSIFILSISSIGLHFYFGYIILILSFILLGIKSKDDFLIALLILTFSFGLVKEGTIFGGVKSYDVIIPFIFIAYFIFNTNRKKLSKEFANIIKAFGLFLSINLIIEIISSDNVTSKLAGFRYFGGFLFILLPFIIYNKKDYDFNRLLNRLVDYWDIFAILIILQSIIIRYPLFFTYLTDNKSGMDENIRHSFILRVYPQAFFLIIFYLFSKGAEKHKLSEIIINVLATLGSLTRSLWAGIIGSLIMGKKSGSKIKFILFVFITFITIYILQIFYNTDFRILSFYYQFYDAFALGDFNSLGTGRFEQAFYPILTFLSKGNIFWGVGFLSAEKSTGNWLFSYLFTGDNHFITEIEVTPIAYFISGGIIGLANLFIFLFILWKIIKKYKYSHFFLQSLIFILIAQLGGFYSFQSSDTWGILGLIIAMILLDNQQIREQLIKS